MSKKLLAMLLVFILITTIIMTNSTPDEKLKNTYEEKEDAITKIDEEVILEDIPNEEEVAKDIPLDVLDVYNEKIKDHEGIIIAEFDMIYLGRGINLKMELPNSEATLLDSKKLKPTPIPNDILGVISESYTYDKDKKLFTYKDEALNQEVDIMVNAFIDSSSKTIYIGEYCLNSNDYKLYQEDDFFMQQIGKKSSIKEYIAEEINFKDLKLIKRVIAMF